MDCYRDEIFGPVLVCLEVDTLDEVCSHVLFTVLFTVELSLLFLSASLMCVQAIGLVNANEWGNGTAIFTTSGAVARKYTNTIESGQVRCV
jgi:malonate-semialdehyde dehydrogenase (acetylating) / methylmalonate-semialdehyde dehydrogenase